MTRTSVAAVLLTVLIAVCPAAPAVAQTIYGVTASDGVVALDASRPGVLSEPVPISGLAPDEDVVGVDVRPATLQLIALGSSGRVYRVDAVSGVAAPLGSGAPIGTRLDGRAFGLDVDPAADRLRITSDTGQNLRVDPDEADLAASADDRLAYGAGDPAAGDRPGISAIAHTRNHPASATFPDPPATVLYGIDAARPRGADTLVRLAAPGQGRLATVGRLGLDAGPSVALDVVTAADGSGETAYAVLQRARDGRSGLYEVDLRTGRARLRGRLPAGDRVEEIAVAAEAPTFLALTAGARQGLVTFRADRPGITGPVVAVSGVRDGEQLVALDTRPADGRVYAVGSASRLYRVDPATGRAAAVQPAPFSPGLSGRAFGADFDPIADRLRIVSDDGYNGRFTATAPVTAGAPGGDARLAHPVGQGGPLATPGVTAAAHTNPVTGATSARLFDVDTRRNLLVTQEPPDGGRFDSVGPLGINPTDVNGFDIVERFDHPFAAFQLSGQESSYLYAVNASAPPGEAADGSATEIGAIGLPAGTVVTGLTALRPVRPTIRALVTAGRDRRAPLRLRIRGRVVAPEHLGRSACAGGRVGMTVRVDGAARTLVRRAVFLDPACRFARRETLSRERVRRARGRLIVTVRFRGTSALAERIATRVARFR